MVWLSRFQVVLVPRALGSLIITSTAELHFQLSSLQKYFFYLLLLSLIFFFWDRISLCSPGWPGTLLSRPDCLSSDSQSSTCFCLLSAKPGFHWHFRLSGFESVFSVVNLECTYLVVRLYRFLSLTLVLLLCNFWLWVHLRQRQILASGRRL